MAQKSKQKAKTRQDLRRQRLYQELVKKDRLESAGLVDEDLEEETDSLQADQVIDPALKGQLDLLDAENEDILEKDYYPPVYSADIPTGPTSFEELDAAQAAQEQAEQVSDASWDTRRLVSNILNHPVMDAKEKATAIKGVGSGFEKRISSILASPKPIQKDLDVLSLESVLAHDRRTTTLVNKLVDKARISLTSLEKLPDENFAIVKEISDEKVRKYPIHDAAHTRAALELAAQDILRGGEGAVLAKEAMPLIRSAARQFGIEMTMKQDKNAMVVEKDETGVWRWVGWVSNNFQDSDGDIIAEVAHKEYVEFLDNNKHMAPAFMTWHTPETIRKSSADFWTYENGFLIMSGPLTDGEAEQMLKSAALTDLGMSHGSLVFSRDPEDKRVITKYRMYEVSDLPLENAANQFTALEAISKEESMDYAKYLAGFIGPEKAEELAKQRTAVMQQQLQAAGVKSAEAQAPAPGTPAAAPETAPVIPEHVMKEIEKRLDIPGLSDFVAKSKEAMEKVPLLEALVKELLANKNEDLANLIQPPAGTLAWSQGSRPSEKTETLVPEGDALLKAKPDPGEFWLSGATNTKPIPAQTQ